MNTNFFPIIAMFMCLGGFFFSSCNNSERVPKNEVEEDMSSMWASNEKSERVPKNEVEEDTEVTEGLSPIQVTPDLAFFSLHGPVKKMTGARNILEFDEKGNLIKLNGQDISVKYARDNNGRISIAYMDGDTITYRWDSALMRPASMHGLNTNVMFYYDEWGFTSKWEWESGTITYSYSNIDEYGNWLSLSASDGTGNNRKIEYFDLSPTDYADEMEDLMSPDLVFSELHGPVKKMTCVGNTIEFAKNGRMIRWNGGDLSQKWERDETGRLSIEYNDGVIFYYSWDRTRPTSIDIPMLNEKILIRYGEQGYRTKMEGETISMSFNYSDIDEYGNWLSKSSNDGAEVTREIEYY